MKKRESLDKAELEKLAGELLAELKALTEREKIAGAGSDEHETGSEAFESFENETVWRERKPAKKLRVEKRALAFLPAAHETDTVRGAGFAQDGEDKTGGEDLRDDTLYAASRTPRITRREEALSAAIRERERSGEHSAAGMVSAESISEAFRRDARRYDGAFEKY